MVCCMLLSVFLLLGAVRHVSSLLLGRLWMLAVQVADLHAGTWSHLSLVVVHLLEDGAILRGVVRRLSLHSFFAQLVFRDIADQ